MSKSLTHRIQEILDHYSISKNAFDQAIGMGNGYIGKQMKRNASLGSKTLETILLVFPEINPAWLILGEGLVFREEVDSRTIDHFEKLLLSYLEKPMVREKIFEIVQSKE